MTIREGEQLARLDHIFTHKALARSGVLYVFLIITPVNETGHNEPLTGLPIFKPRGGVSILDHGQDNFNDASQMIIGLPALGPDKLYMVPYNPDSQTMITADMHIPEECELLHVNWRTHFHG